ncbi:MAG: hypothetical protein R3C28_23335 [Pirellulaceae bacterium]
MPVGAIHALHFSIHYSPHLSIQRFQPSGRHIFAGVRQPPVVIVARPFSPAGPVRGQYDAMHDPVTFPEGNPQDDSAAA